MGFVVDHQILQVLSQGTGWLYSIWYKGAYRGSNYKSVAWFGTSCDNIDTKQISQSFTAVIIGQSGTVRIFKLLCGSILIITERKAIKPQSGFIGFRMLTAMRFTEAGFNLDFRGFQLARRRFLEFLGIGSTITLLYISKKTRGFTPAYCFRNNCFANRAQSLAVRALRLGLILSQGARNWNSTQLYPLNLLWLLQILSQGARNWNNPLRLGCRG